MSRESCQWLESRLQGEGAPLVIDGGMGTELERNGVPMDESVWSARAMISHPELVRAVHERFIRAGAEVILTNTFSAARHMLEPAGSGDQTVSVNQRAVELAMQARDEAASWPVAIAGSICEWVSAENSRWCRPRALADSVREQAEILASSGVDLIAFEMCQTLEHSCACIEAALEFDLPLWIGVSARTHPRQDRLAVFDYPEYDFAELVEAVSGYPVMILNVMHSPVNDVSAAIDVVKQYWEGPVGVYPESGVFEAPHWCFVDVVSPDALAELAIEWVDDRVRLVGGCCGLGPEHIAALRNALNPI